MTTTPEQVAASAYFNPEVDGARLVFRAPVNLMTYSSSPEAYGFARSPIRYRTHLVNAFLVGLSLGAIQAMDTSDVAGRLDQWILEQMDNDARLRAYEAYLERRIGHSWNCGNRYGVRACQLSFLQDQIAHREAYSGRREVNFVHRNPYLEIVMDMEMEQAFTTSPEAIHPSPVETPTAAPTVTPPGWRRRLRFRRPD